MSNRSRADRHRKRQERRFAEAASERTGFGDIPPLALIPGQTGVEWTGAGGMPRRALSITCSGCGSEIAQVQRVEGCEGVPLLLVYTVTREWAMLTSDASAHRFPLRCCGQGQEWTGATLVRRTEQARTGRVRV